MVEVSWFFKGKGTIVPCEVSYPTDDHFSQRWMNIKEKCSVDVPTSHFSEMSFIPAHPCWLVHFFESGPASEDQKEAETQPEFCTFLCWLHFDLKHFLGRQVNNVEGVRDVPEKVSKQWREIQTASFKCLTFHTLHANLQIYESTFRLSVTRSK